MRTPDAIITEVERVTRLLLAGQTSYEEGIDAVEPLLAKDEHKLFLVELHRKWIRGQIKGCKAQLLAVVDYEKQTGQAPLPFPDLPPLIEIAPGTFKHQNVMNELQDWDKALVQAETKALNAAGYLERIRRARDQWIRQYESGEEKQA